MKDESWKKTWKQHVEKAGKDPFSQVGRTLNSQPMSNSMFLKIADHFIEHMELDTNHVVLDFCCGNGLLSNEIAKRCKQVVGVDFSEKLIADLEFRESKNIIGVIADALEISFKPNSFHRVVFAAALQHFTEPQAVHLFRKMFKWLKPGGILLVTDITDSQRMWNFYNNKERRNDYFKCTADESSILGTWFDRKWLVHLANHVGFDHAEDIDQPEDYWYTHYRFDLLCRK